MYKALIITLLFFSANLKVSAQQVGQNTAQIPSQVVVQQADFESYPKMDADYSHLQLELSVGSSGALEGEAFYSFRLLRSDVDTLLLDAVELDIQSVVMSGEQLEFTTDNEKLQILLPGGLQTDTVYMLRISYEAAPGFGILNDEWEMVRTSLLPGAVRHWLPVVDHPRNRLTTDVTLSYASGSTASFSGSPSLSGIVSVEQQQMRFVSDEPIPVTALTFAIGISDRSQITSGRNRIYLMARSDLLNDDRMNRLLETADRSLQQASQVTGADYPYRDLQIVVLDDPRWEIKNYGAGIIYIYVSGTDTPGNSLEDQIIRGIAAQWYGVSLVEEQWTDAGAVVLLQEWLVRQLAIEVSSGNDSFANGNSADQNRGRETAGNTATDTGQSTDPGVTYPSEEGSRPREWGRATVPPAGLNGNSLYYAFTPEAGDDWFQWLQSESDEAIAVKEVIESPHPVYPVEGQGILPWRNFANFIYDRTGLPMLDSPAPVRGIGIEEEAEENERYPYTVTFELDDAETTLRLLFQAEGSPVNELVPVTVYEHGIQGIVERDLSFTGNSDEVVLSVSPGINNLNLVVSGDAAMDVQLEQQKPLMFWVYQLRNSEDSLEKAEAAEGLHRYAENPDLQLALMDVLRAEEDPYVSAAILRTLAAVTNGAAGTSQLFLQRYDANAPVEHKLAIIDAYTNYEGNEQVINRLQQIVTETDNRNVRIPVINALAVVTDAERFLAITQSLIPNPEVTSQVPLLLHHLAEKGEAEQAVRMAGALLNPGYSFNLRLGGLELLLEYDQSQEGWNERLPELLTDGDPRIRYKAVDGLEYLSSQARNRLVEEQLESEYDERVVMRLQSL